MTKNSDQESKTQIDLMTKNFEKERKIHQEKIQEFEKKIVFF